MTTKFYRCKFSPEQVQEVVQVLETVGVYSAQKNLSDMLFTACLNEYAVEFDWILMAVWCAQEQKEENVLRFLNLFLRSATLSDARALLAKELNWDVRPLVMKPRGAEHMLRRIFEDHRLMCLRAAVALTHEAMQLPV